MKSKFKVLLLSFALIGSLFSATACDEYLYGFEAYIVGVSDYPIFYGGYYYVDDDDYDDYYDDLEDYWDDLEDDWEDFFDD